MAKEKFIKKPKGIKHKQCILWELFRKKKGSIK